MLNYLKMLSVSANVLILGDFNLPDIDWYTLSSSNKRSDMFCDFVFDCGLSQLILEIQLIGKAIFWTWYLLTYVLLENINVSIDLFLNESDHYPIQFDILLNIHNTSNCIPKEVYQN